jgi:hypothetical protein
VFAAGVILYILLCGYPPFNAKSVRQLFVRTVKGKASSCSVTDESGFRLWLSRPCAATLLSFCCQNRVRGGCAVCSGSTGSCMFVRDFGYATTLALYCILQTLY